MEMRLRIVTIVQLIMLIERKEDNYNFDLFIICLFIIYFVNIISVPRRVVSDMISCYKWERTFQAKQLALDVLFKKKSVNSLEDEPRPYIYIYIYIYEKRPPYILCKLKKNNCNYIRPFYLLYKIMFTV
jgi:hypothetical protein